MYKLDIEKIYVKHFPNGYAIVGELGKKGSYNEILLDYYFSDEDMARLSMNYILNNVVQKIKENDNEN